MTNEEIYNAGLILVRKLATMEANSINEDPNHDMKAHYAIFDRVCGFVGWAKEHGYIQNLRVFITAQKNRETFGEYTSMVEMLELRGVKIY